MAIDPMTGKTIGKRQQVLTYGLSFPENQRIRKCMPPHVDVVPCQFFSDLLAWDSVFSFVSTDSLSDQELASLVEFHSTTDNG